MIRLLSFADFISISNAVFGILAILVLFTELIGTLELRIHISLSLILLGLLADGLDGIVARKFKKSEIGIYLEAMADMASMVVAPAVFIYFVYSDVVSYSIYREIYLFVALVLFLFFGIVRLASFNIMKEKKTYIGLPASASAVILLILAYFQVDYLFILPTVVIIGAVMASDIVFPKAERIINGAALILIILTIVFGKSYYGFAPILLIAAILVYVIGGPIYKKFLEKK
jgi:CDP-diacylglycerol--serine O-phosphatidyltransferase